jgi:Carboxypeptidase regulatory-like domain
VLLRIASTFAHLVGTDVKGPVWRRIMAHPASGSKDGRPHLKMIWKRMPRCLWPWGGLHILLAFLVSAAPPSNAQLATTTAAISGVVTDASGAVVPGALVTLTSLERGLSHEFKTDAAGRYAFSQLPPAPYTLTVKMSGFETYKQNGIVLNAAQTATQNVSLTIGSETQSITVTANASLLDVDNSNVAADLPSSQITEMPLISRNVFGLATLNSSVSNTSESQMLLGGGTNTTDDADQDISFMNFAGGFFGTTGFLVDGSWDTDSEWGGVIFVPSVDAVQEFKVQNNSFTAQYGWSTGNVINVVTKSGTNTFHGDAWDFYQNQDLNAVPYFSNSNQSLFREEAGVAAGGPLYIPGLYKQREKTFIFGLYDYLTISSPTVDTYTVPDSNFVNGNFSEILEGQGKAPNGSLLYDDLGRPILVGQIYDPKSAHYIVAGQADTPGPTNPYGTGLVAVNNDGQCNPGCYVRNPVSGNILSNISGYKPDPIGAKLLSYYPAAKIPGPVANNLVISGTAPAHWNEYSMRVDHNFSDNTRGYYRYSYKEEYKTGAAADWGDDPAGPGNGRPNNRWGMWAGYSHIFSPTLTLNLTSGVQIWHETSDNQSFGFNPSTTLGLPAYVDQNYPMFPMVDVSGQSSMGPGANDQQAVTNHGPIGTVSADFIKLRGKHTLNFGWTGVEQVFSQKPYFMTILNFSGTYTAGPDPSIGSGVASGNSVAEMLLGVIDPGTATGYDDSPYESDHLFGWYLQDDWKPIRNLTLNLGVRYEIQTPYTYRHNAGSIFNPNALNPLSYSLGRPLLGELQFLGPGNRYVYNPNWDNWAPRLGFSYQPIAKAVVHGGYGIFYPESLTSSGAADQDGFSSETSAVATLDGGILPNPNISTSSPWGGVYAQQTQNANGGYQQVGNGVGGAFRSRPSPYVQQWMLGIQYAFTPSDQLDVDYIGNRGVRMIGGYGSNQLNPQYLQQYTAAQLKAPAASNPFAAPLQSLEAGGTVAPSSCSLDATASIVDGTAVGPSLAQLLSPFPQYCNGGVNQTDAPVGQSLYNALQVTYNHRVSKGLTALVSYTYSKFLDNVEGNNGWSYNGPTNAGVTPANNYNLAADKSVDAGDIPQALVASYIYQLPIGRGKAVGANMGRATDAILGGWEISGTATFKAGIPIGILGYDQPTFGGNPRPDVTGNVHVSNPNHHEWFNTGAFDFAPYGSFGDAPRFFSDLRGPHFQEWDTIMEKNFYFAEKMLFQFRFETYNTFNHPNFYAPEAGSTSWSGCDPNGGSGCQSGFGTITQTFTPRNIQWAGKFYW